MGNLLIWAVTGVLTEKRPFRPRTWAAAAFAGAVGALALYTVLHGLFDYGDLSRTYVTFAFPLVMSALLLQGVVFVGLAGREMTAADLEWWSGGLDHDRASFQEWPICLESQESNYATHRCHPADGGFGETGVVFGGLLLLGFITSKLVPANKFSLHHMYHHRLTRAYLGA